MHQAHVVPELVSKGHILTVVGLSGLIASVADHGIGETGVAGHAALVVAPDVGHAAAALCAGIQWPQQRHQIRTNLGAFGSHTTESPLPSGELAQQCAVGVVVGDIDQFESDTADLVWQVAGRICLV